MTAIDIAMPTGKDTEDRSLLHRLREYLAREEATNSIQLSGFHDRDAFAPGEQVLVALRDGAVVGVATLPPPFNPVLSHVEHDAALPALAGHAHQHGWRPPGVMGPGDTARAFAMAWRDLTGQEVRPGMVQRILAATSVDLPAVQGRSRRASAGDRDIIRDWIAAFVIEAQHGTPEEAARAAADFVSMEPASARGTLLWLDTSDLPVSLAHHKAPTRRGVRIGPVYTPPAHRRHGYAAAVTAATTQVMLDQGFDFVCLYTDATNPTANHVYESIGYRLVTTSMQYRFEAAATP
jgi:predicted GNAT family acetyltransferase